MKKHGRFFKVQFTVWIDERACVMRTPLHPDGVTDGMAVYEALVVDTEYDGWVLDWEETEMCLTQVNERRQ
tara:strand:+ start:180 stop:392 length:213 start_codon:yes stop_codon:yes gene_type:complete